MDRGRLGSIPDRGEPCRSGHEEGQVLFIVVMLIAVLLALVGLAVDSAMLYLKQASLQSKADAAALAAVQMLPDADAARQAAELYVRLNGQEPHTSIEVDVSMGSRQAGAVTVILTQQVPLSFLAILNLDSAQITAEATASQAPMVADLILALDSAQCNRTGRAQDCRDIRQGATILAAEIMDRGGRIGIVDCDRSAQQLLAPSSERDQVMGTLADWGTGEKMVQEYNPGDAVWLSASIVGGLGGERPVGIVLVTSGDASVGRGCCAECKCSGDQLAECDKKCDYGRCCARWAQQAAYYAWQQGAFVFSVDGTGSRQGTDLMRTLADLADDGQQNGSETYYILVGDREGKAPRPGDYQKAMRQVAERLPGGLGERLVR